MLFVIYNGNNYIDVGWWNLFCMKEVFGVDYIIYLFGVELFKKLNWIGFVLMGDMNWYVYVGIMMFLICMVV